MRVSIRPSAHTPKRNTPGCGPTVTRHKIPTTSGDPHVTGAIVENITEKDLTDEAEDSMLLYAVSVITARALPAVEDGLKPVQRRILFDMYRNKVVSAKPTVKSAQVVGSVLGTLHPHGDSSAYEALVRLVQPWAMSLPLIEGQGNFGSVGGEDPPAAYRYTECRLTPAAEALLEGLGEGTVDFSDNYDATLKEPDLLPAAFPNLLVNGTSGIAVGVACRFAPHNLREVVAGLRHLLAHPDATVEDLQQHIPGPDFPTGGAIVGDSGVSSGYATGRGVFHLRGKMHAEDVSARRKEIVITELPYGVSPESIITNVGKLKKEEKLDEVSSISDNSDLKHGTRVVVGVKNGADPDVVMAKLFKLTPMQVSFGMNHVALIGTEPRTMGLLEICQHYLRHRREVVNRRTRFRLDKAEARAHIVEGLIKAHDHIDEVVELIKASANAQEAREALQDKFGLSEAQATNVLEMTLRRLTNLEITQLTEELTNLNHTIKNLKALLESEKKMDDLIGRELQAAADQFGGPRRTQLLREDSLPAIESDAALGVEGPAGAPGAPAEPRTYVVAADGTLHLEGSAPENQPLVTTLSTDGATPLVAITKWGKAHYVNPADLGEGGFTRDHYVEGLEEGDTVVALLPGDASEYLLVTRNGMIKRIERGAFTKRSGSAIQTYKDDDHLVSADAVTGECGDVLLVSSDGKALRTSAADIRPQGRTAAGVASIKLADGASVLTAAHIPPNTDRTLVTLTDKGTVKATATDLYPVKGRRGGGVQAQPLAKAESALVGAVVVDGKPAAGTARTLKELPLAKGRGTTAKKAPGSVVALTIGAGH